MSTAEQFHVDEVSPSYWRVTFDNGPVNLLDSDTIDQLGALIARVESDPAMVRSGIESSDLTPRRVGAGDYCGRAATIVTVHEFSPRRPDSLVPFWRVGHRDAIEETRGRPKADEAFAAGEPRILE